MAVINWADSRRQERICKRSKTSVVHQRSCRIPLYSAAVTRNVLLTSCLRNTACDVRYKVWTFVLGPSSRPRWMLARPEGRGCVFPRNRQGSGVTITVDGTTHTLIATATSTIVPTRSTSSPACCKAAVVDFSVEDELLVIMHILTVWELMPLRGPVGLTNWNSIKHALPLPMTNKPAWSEPIWGLATRCYNHGI